MKAFSQNVIFVDTEFSDLDPYTGEILSVGLCKRSGQQLYVEVEHAGEVHPWVRTNILPTLDGNPVSREEAKRQITEFVGPDKPYMVAFVPQYDMVYMVKLFGRDALPFHWMAIDFASMLFGQGEDPTQLRSERRDALLRACGYHPDAYRSHHALDDARVLRDIWEAYINQGYAGTLGA